MHLRERTQKTSKSEDLTLLARHPSPLSCKGRGTLLLPRPTFLAFVFLKNSPSISYSQCPPQFDHRVQPANQSSTYWGRQPKAGFPATHRRGCLVPGSLDSTKRLLGPFSGCHSPSCQIKTLGCRALGLTLVTATSTSQRVVFLISEISSLEKSLSWRKPGIVGMRRGCQSPAILRPGTQMRRETQRG